MKIKTLVLASCLSFSMNSFAANNTVKETSEESKKESAGYVASGLKWCGENKWKCGTAIGTMLVIGGYSIYSISVSKNPMSESALISQYNSLQNRMKGLNSNSSEYAKLLNESNRVEDQLDILATVGPDLLGSSLMAAPKVTYSAKPIILPTAFRNPYEMSDVD